MVGENLIGTPRHSLETEIFAGIAGPLALAAKLRLQHTLLRRRKNARQQQPDYQTPPHTASH
jgi:hypothetical protein